MDTDSEFPLAIVIVFITLPFWFDGWFVWNVDLCATSISENCDQKGQQTLQARRLEQNFQSDHSSCQEAPQRMRAAVTTIIIAIVISAVFSFGGVGGIS